MAKITVGKPEAKARLLHTIVLGFSADPMARWAFPDPAVYLDRRDEFFDAFGGAAFDHGTAFVAEDGAAVDEEGCYWTALFEGGRVQRYAPDGRLLAEYRVPAFCPTMVAFGGADRRTLFVTSARAERPDDLLSERDGQAEPRRDEERRAGPAHARLEAAEPEQQ